MRRAKPPRRRGEVETLQARAFGRGRLRRVGFSCLIFCILFCQQWALGLAASLPEDVRVKFEEWYSSVEIEAKASVDPYSEVLSQGSPATLLPADPVSSTPVAATSAGFAFRAAKAPFPSQRATPYAVGFQVSKSQERPPGADQFVNAVAQPLPDADVQAGVRRRGQRVLRLAQWRRTLSFARWQIFYEEFLLMSCAVAGS